MQQLIATVIGDDRAGIVDQLAQVVIKYQGNWMASSMMELAGQFAGIIQINIADEHVQAFSDELSHQHGLQVSIARGIPQTSTSPSPMSIKVTANDRAGIVSEVTQILRQLEISLIDIETRCSPAPNWGGNIFEASLSIGTPSPTRLEQLQSALEALADDLMVDVIN